MKEIFNVSLTRDQLWEVRRAFLEKQDQMTKTLQYAIDRDDVLLIKTFSERLADINKILKALPEL